MDFWILIVLVLIFVALIRIGAQTYDIREGLKVLAVQLTAINSSLDDLKIFRP